MESSARLRGLGAALTALMGSAAAATEEGRRERVRLEEALQRARVEQERLAELQRRRTEYCNICGRANTPYSGCGYGGRSPSVSSRWD